MEMQRKYGSFINNKFVYGEKVYPCTNPATGRSMADICVGGTETVDAAVEAAQAAFKTFRKTSRGARAALLRAMADRIQENIDFLAMVDSMDTGKPIGEATGHLGACMGVYRYFASVIEAKEDVAISHDNGSISYVVREPLGVAGLIVAWNCPLMLLSWKLAPALAAGNTVVIKPSVLAVAGVSELLRLWNDILPAGVVNMVLGSGGEIGDYFTAHPGINKLSFTGSIDVGRTVGAAGGRRLVPTTLELGGKSAAVVFEDADLDRALQMTCGGILGSAGGICVGNSRVLVQDTVYDKFLGMLKEKFERVRVGDPLDPANQMGPVTEEKQMKKILDYIASGKEEGATLVCGGYRVTDNGCADGYFIAPTIFGDVKPGMRIEQEEIFGPVICVIKFHDEDEAIAIANGTQYGLGGAVWTKDIYRALRFCREYQAGIIWVNDYLDCGPGQPFGGFKNSGIGREVNQMALENYTQVKNICIATDQSVPAMW